MPKFEVIIQRVITQEATFVVEAPNRYEAEITAIAFAKSGDDEIAWTATDGNYEVSEITEV